jgi:hypothetical protein
VALLMRQLRVEGDGLVRARCPGVYPGAGRKAAANPRNNAASGQCAAKAMRTRLAVSTMRAAIFKSRARKVANSALASGCGFGMAARTVSISQ